MEATYKYEQDEISSKSNHRDRLRYDNLELSIYRKDGELYLESENGVNSLGEPENCSAGAFLNMAVMESLTLKQLIKELE